MKNVSAKICSFLFLLCALALVGSLSGCQAWSAWLDFLKFEAKKPVAKASSGDDFLQENISASKGVPLEIIRPAQSPRITVLKITVPVGTLSGNDKAWQQVSEDVLDTKTSVMLAQNGLRAGSAPQNRWAGLSKLLDVPGARTEQFACQTDGRSSLNVVTRPNVAEQLVVSIDHDLRQTVRTLEKCDNAFRLSMRLLKGKSELFIQLEPVATLGTISVQREEHEMGVTRTGFIMEESFSDLRLGAVLPQDHFLVISAADPKTNKYSVGSLWLAETQRLPATETVLVFVPSIPSATPPKK